MSYEAFQAHIEAVIAALGEPKLRQVVADHAIECLRVEVQSMRGLRWSSDLHWGTWWTSCSPAEFDAGRARSEATLHQDTSSLGLQPTAEGEWRGTTLRLRGLRVQAEGGEYRLILGSCYPGHTSYDRRLQRDVAKWSVSISREAMDITGHRHSGKSSSSQANTEAAGIKALRRMVKDFFGTELVNL